MKLEISMKRLGLGRGIRLGLGLDFLMGMPISTVCQMS